MYLKKVMILNPTIDPNTQITLAKSSSTTFDNRKKQTLKNPDIQVSELKQKETSEQKLNILRRKKKSS